MRFFRSGQVESQVFIYIITLMIVMLVLGLGYKAISGFKEKSSQVSFIQFENDVQNSIEVMTTDYGSVKVKEFAAPDGIVKICIVKNYNGMPTLSNTGYPLMEDSVNSGVNKNIFLIGDVVEDSFYGGIIDIASDYYCVSSVGQRIKLKIEGMGDHVLVS